MITPETGADMSGSTFVVEEDMPELLVDIETCLGTKNPERYLRKHYPTTEAQSVVRKIGNALFIGAAAIGCTYVATTMYTGLARSIQSFH